MSDVHVRQLPICLSCKGAKDQGLVLCWPCHREQKRLNEGGYSPEVQDLIDRFEAGKIMIACQDGVFQAIEEAE